MSSPLDRVDYCPIIDRPVITWPGGARVAFWVSPNVEYYEFIPESGGVRDPYPRSPYPDVQTYASFDYGNRIGFWRMVDVLDRHGIRCTVSLSLGVLDHFPEVKEAMIERNWDFMSHGFYNTQFMTTFTEDQERAYIRDNVETFRRHMGRPLKGFFGPSASSTERTPDVLAEAGIIYHCDWMHDDQPVPIKVKTGKLVSVPYSVETNDGVIFRTFCEGSYFVRLCKAQFDRLYAEGAESGRVMCIAIHPCWTGQPHRIKYLDEILGYIMSHDGVWQTTADEIAEYFIANFYDEVAAHAAALNG